MTASSDRASLQGPTGRLRAAIAFIGVAGGALGFYMILNAVGVAALPPENGGLLLTAPAAIAIGGLLVIASPIAGAVLMALGAAALIFLFGGVVLGNLVPVVCGFAGAALAVVDFTRSRGPTAAGAGQSAEARQAVDFAVALKDAAVAAIIALALAGPIVGLQTVAGPNNQLALNQRWMPVAVIVAVVFVGRLFLNLFVWQPTATPRPAGFAWFKRASVGGRPLAMIGTHARLIVGVVAIVGAVVLPFLPFATRYVMDQSIVVLNYSMLGWGLNIVVGLAGLLDLGYVAFYAVGAYSFALLAHYLDWGFWACLPFAGILAACWGMILGFPVLRLRGDYLAIVTLAFGEIIRIILRNWDEFTGGPNGLLDIPAPTLFGIPFNRSPDGFAATFGFQYTTVQKIVFLYYIILALALVTNFFSLRMRRLPIGRAWEALREDEIACRSLGINTTNTKLTAFACGAMFGGFAGAFFASRQGFVSPESFNSTESFIILAVVVLGGLGSQLGIVIAVIILNTLFEVLREFPSYRMLIVGLSLVLIMVWRPRGLISTRQPSIFLKQRRSVSAELVGEGRG